MRMRKKPNLAARLERCAHLKIDAPGSLRGAWHDLMPGARALWLELGCGKGRFTVETAAANPDILFVAVERVPDAMVIAMERAEHLGLTNVFFIDGDAARLEDDFTPGEVNRLYINFCDPWPSRRHARRRLTHENFLILYRKILAADGEIHFKTDNRDLFEYSLLQFPQAGFALSQVTRNLHEAGPQAVMTDYEAKFHLEGLPICRCVGTRLELEQEPECSPEAGLAILPPPK